MKFILLIAFIAFLATSNAFRVSKGGYQGFLDPEFEVSYLIRLKLLHILS